MVCCGKSSSWAKLFAVSTISTWLAVEGMFRHHRDWDAVFCTLSHIRAMNRDYGHPVAPECWDPDYKPWGSQYYNWDGCITDLLLRRIAGWLEPDGRLFVHHFSHRESVYPYEAASERDWMARFFFSGGIMPSDGLLLEFQDDLRVEERWRVGGEHYRLTSEAWLANLDTQREALLPVLAATYGESEAERWWVRWRFFFLACAELFGFHGGDEWFVTHVRMAPRGRS